MFDIGWGELVVIGIVALIVIGPKELPTVMRTAGQWMGKIRRMASEFQSQFQEALREAELSDLKKHAEDLKTSVTDATSFDPLADIDNDGNMSEPAKPEPAKIEAPAELSAPSQAETQSSPEASPAELPAAVTEKDLAPAEPPPPKQAGGKA
jgi:sec-independent protein translocase protein TatB